MSGTAAPTRQQAGQLQRGNTEAIRLFQNPVAHTTTQPRPQQLYPVDEVQDLSPKDYLLQSPDLSAPYMSVTLSPALKRGELQTQGFSYLSTSSRSDFNWQMPYSSSPTGSVMSRCNTDDLLSGPVNLLRVDSSASHCKYSVGSGSTTINAYTFPSQTEMKRLPSEESNASSLSSSSQRGQSRMSRRVSEQNAQSKARPLAPKQEYHDDSSSTKAKTLKIVEVTSDDGTIRHKAEIPRTTRQQPQRLTTFCQLCDDHPQGFHGEHELSRHVERHHTSYRKVWICKDSTLKDAPRPVVPLSNCKACRNSKTYGANYNAAAHLRRAHFFPCKNKRGGRGKVSDGRGGMGGGDEPSMDELKNWMYEVNGADTVPQSAPPELSQIGNDMFPEFNLFDDAVPYNHISLNIPQEYANSYDWNSTQYGADLVSRSYQSINSAGSVID
jgi:hypothetical protein